MENFSVKYDCISDPLVEAVFSNVRQLDLQEWKKFLKEEKKVSDGLNSIEFLKFDQILQQQLYNISFPMIRFRFFGASKTTRKLSKPPKIITMSHLWVETDPCFEYEKLTLDIKDFVFFVRNGILIYHFDFFQSKLLHAINTCALRDFYIKLPTMDQVLKAVDLIPNVYKLTIRWQDENLIVDNDEFEILTRKIAIKTKFEYIEFINFNFPNNWEKICKENFKNFSHLCHLVIIMKSVPNISINVIDLYDLITENNIAVLIYEFLDDSFVELPEFKHRFKAQEQRSNQKKLYISKNDKIYYPRPL